MRLPLSLLAVAVAGLVSPPDAGAQKPVLLQLRPRVGDTLAMRVEQRTELVGKRADPKAAPTSYVAALTTWSRAIVESGVATATTIVAITDSMVLSPNPRATKGPAPAAAKPLQPQRVRLALAPDGSIEMADSTEQSNATLSRTVSLIPATFPITPVAIGEKWMREAPLPAGTSQLGTTVVGWVHATFRLDSLTRDGDLAWISMRGELKPDLAASRIDGVASVDDGVVEGWMVVDRDRGWLTESRFTIVAHSTLRAPFGTTAAPMSFEIRITQALRTAARER